MFPRTRTTARINAYMIYASSTSTPQPEQTDNFVLSRANVGAEHRLQHMEPNKS